MSGYVAPNVGVSITPHSPVVRGIYEEGFVCGGVMKMGLDGGRMVVDGLEMVVDG